MKKIIVATIGFIMVLSYLFTPIVVLASSDYYGTVTAPDGLNVRQGPGTNYLKLGKLALNTEVQLANPSISSATNGCNSGWYQINYGGSTNAYVCGDYLYVYTKQAPSEQTDSDYENYLKNLGFPSTYWSYLTNLHKAHPNWTFEAVPTSIGWSDAVSKASIVGNSLIQTNYDGWKSTASGSYDEATNTFYVLEGSNWYAAHPSVVAYYMDPRNFLDETHVFMFEKLSYDASYQTEGTVKAVFNGGSFANYSAAIYDAGKAYNINPIYLASRIRQEVGSNVGASNATTGLTFTYDGRTYSGLYNVYNIGATTGSNALYRGLVWANGGSDGTATSYGRPWKSLEASIMGGAQMLAGSYISKGQYTNYFQRFNVAPFNDDPNNPSYLPLTHSYMTNIRAVESESAITYSSYKSMGLLNTPFKFAIPVYSDMPTSTSLPSTEFVPVDTAAVTRMKTVQSIQSTINSKYSMNLSVDGAPGPKTLAAMTKALQMEINNKYNARLNVDGWFGPFSKSKSPSILRGGDADFTWLIQAKLYIKGYELNADGDFGPHTETIVKMYQNDNGLCPDGIVGPKTFESLFKN